MRFYLNKLLYLLIRTGYYTVFRYVNNHVVGVLSDRVRAGNRGDIRLSKRSLDLH